MPPWPPLSGEGLVVTRKGFGSYVRDRQPLRRVSSTHRHASHRASGKPQFDTEAITQGQTRRAGCCGLAADPSRPMSRMAAMPARGRGSDPETAAAPGWGARSPLGQLLPAVVGGRDTAGITGRAAARVRTT